MKPKQQIKSIPPESGSKKNQNLVKPNQKPRRVKNNFRPDQHYISSNKNDKIFNNTFYNRNERNNKNINKVVDVNASIKHGRNTSAPHLKDKKINNKKINKNSNDYYAGISPNKYNSHSIDTRDNVLYKNHNQPKRQYNLNKNNNVNHRINNIKQNYNSKTNKKLYNNDLNKYVTVKNDFYNNYTSDLAKNKRRNPNIKSNNLSTMKIKEKIELIRKQMKDKKSNEIGLIGQRLKNTKQKSHNRYNYSFGKNSNMNNTINYNPVTKMNIGTIDNDNDDDEDNEIEIDNEEKILKTDDHADFSQNNGDMEANYNSEYADITPTKKENYSNNYLNNFNSIDTSSSKFASSNIKDNYYSKKDYNKKGLNVSGHSYNKKNDFVKKINIGTENNKFLFNNFVNYNSNRNTEKSKKKSKSKKIKIVNYPQSEYHYNKSSNVFNTVNNKLNKSSISTSNYNRTIDTSHDKNLNKSKNNVSFGKKNNSVKRIKMNSDVNKDIIMNRLMGKRNVDKVKVNRENNKSLNYSFDKNLSNKSKKNAPKVKNIKKVENIDNQENQENQEIKQQEKVTKTEENKKRIRMIEKIGCICHAGEISYGNPKINQDNYFNYKINTDDLVFVGVCDGHGENGHYVSEYLINHLPQDFNEAYIDLQQKEKKTYEDISLESITKTFEESFLKTDNDLNEFCNNMKKKKLVGENVPNYYNCDYSGSTCVSILLKQNDINKVYIANVGDSRTIVIREKDNNWTCKQLSRDHKPTEKDEYNRIIEADGEIEAIEDDNGNWTGPLRVWEKGSEGPGLAMTRSLGDKVGSKIGVVCTPEVFKYFIKEEDRAFIIASDGLWEYMNNQDVTNSVKELITNMRNNNEDGEINADLISRELFNQSVERWRQKEQGIDDITIICVILN